MRTVQAYPPNWDAIKIILKPIGHEIFCYGNTIYNPSGRSVTPDIERHEEVHSEQQGSNPDAWWNKYLSDKTFRLACEIEAYGEQWLFAKENVKDAKLLAWVKENMAMALCGPSYGGLISYGEAESKIRNYRKA